jgi:hypothetical protein
VLVFVDGVRAQRAFPQPIGRTHDAAPPPPAPQGPKTNYRASEPPKL